MTLINCKKHPSQFITHYCTNNNCQTLLCRHCYYDHPKGHELFLESIDHLKERTMNQFRQVVKTKFDMLINTVFNSSIADSLFEGSIEHFLNQSSQNELDDEDLADCLTRELAIRTITVSVPDLPLAENANHNLFSFSLPDFALEEEFDDDDKEEDEEIESDSDVQITPKKHENHEKIPSQPCLEDFYLTGNLTCKFENNLEGITRKWSEEELREAVNRTEIYDSVFVELLEIAEQIKAIIISDKELLIMNFPYENMKNALRVSITKGKAGAVRQIGNRVNIWVAQADELGYFEYENGKLEKVQNFERKGIELIEYYSDSKLMTFDSKGVIEILNIILLNEQTMLETLLSFPILTQPLQARYLKSQKLFLCVRNEYLEAYKVGLKSIMKIFKSKEKVNSFLFDDKNGYVILNQRKIYKVKNSMLHLKSTLSENITAVGIIDSKTLLLKKETGIFYSKIYQKKPYMRILIPNDKKFYNRIAQNGIEYSKDMFQLLRKNGAYECEAHLQEPIISQDLKGIKLFTIKNSTIIVADVCNDYCIEMNVIFSEFDFNTDNVHFLFNSKRIIEFPDPTPPSHNKSGSIYKLESSKKKDVELSFESI